MYGSAENPLFKAKDVAEWIEHSNPSKMVSDSDLDQNEFMTATLGTLTNSYSALMLTEDGLYEVLMQSRKPIAKQFKKGIKEILKSIRKTGQYSAQTQYQLPQTFSEALRLAADQVAADQVAADQVEKSGIRCEYVTVNMVDKRKSY